MNQPIISIVTPTKNRQSLLRRCISSVQNQNFQNWEMLVVDDGDGSSLDVIHEIADARARSFQNPGSGHADARNHGVNQACGKIIHLLDDDDGWNDPQHLEKVTASLEQYDALVFRTGWLVLETETASGWLEERRIEFCLGTSVESLRKDNSLLTSGVAYPKKFHDELGLFDSVVGNYWDWDWFLRVTKQYPLCEIPEPAVLVSWRGTNTSANPFQESRIGFLEQLIAKHDLGHIPPKNHFTLLEAGLKTGKTNQENLWQTAI